MKVGDSKQASILSVVAVGIVVFAIYRAIPPKPKFGTAPPEDDSMQLSGKVVYGNVPTKLVYDPFVTLAGTAPTTTGESQADRDKRNRESDAKAEKNQGKNPPKIGDGYNPMSPEGAGTGLKGHLPGVDPKDPGAQGDPQKPVVTVKLMGVMGAGELKALISIDSGEQILVGVGKMAGPARVIKVTTTQVVLQGPSGKKTIAVGGEATFP